MFLIGGRGSGRFSTPGSARICSAAPRSTPWLIHRPTVNQLNHSLKSWGFTGFCWSCEQHMSCLCACCQARIHSRYMFVICSCDMFASCWTISHGLCPTWAVIHWRQTMKRWKMVQSCNVSSAHVPSQLSNLPWTSKLCQRVETTSK